METIHHGLSLLSDVKDYPLGIDIDILKRKVKGSRLTPILKSNWL